jgi:hypothetical protein
VRKLEHTATDIGTTFMENIIKSYVYFAKNFPDQKYFRSSVLSFLLSLAPQPSLGLGLLHKIRLNFLEASQQFSFYRVGLLVSRPTPIPEDQASVFISPRGRVATHFSRLLRHAWVTVGLFLFPCYHTRSIVISEMNIFCHLHFPLNPPSNETTYS